ncbi:hypothetical protein PQX77_013221 [Marasmius sp. AFHP31]|nr:hypothetical protein PQX77_013221 [Marasmius sp. AFHP31]
MPARRRHTTKQAREQALRAKNSKYYQQNKDEIRSKRRAKHAKTINRERKAVKAEKDEKQRVFWEAQAHDVYDSNALEELRSLEKRINAYLSNSGSAYFERIFHEYLAWCQSDHQHTDSPIELPNKVFASMMDAAAKIGNGILNEYGARKEWKQCQRLTMRIRYLIQAVDNLEEVVLEHQAGDSASDSLEERYSKGTLAFQRDYMRQWLDRLHDPTPSPSYSVDEYTEAELQAFDQIMQTTNVSERSSARSSTPVGNTSAASAVRQPSISPSKRPIRLKEGAPPGLHRVAEERAQSAAEEQAQLMQERAQSANEEIRPAAPPHLDHCQSLSPGPFGIHPTTYNHPPQLPHSLHPHPLHSHPHPATSGLHSTSPAPPSAPNTGPQFSYHLPHPHSPHAVSPGLHSTSPVPTSAPNTGPKFSYPAPQHGLHTTGPTAYPYPPPPHAYLQPYGYAPSYGPQHSALPQPQNIATVPTPVAPTTLTTATTIVPPAAPATTTSVSPTTQPTIPTTPPVSATAANVSSMPEDLPSASQLSTSVADTKDLEEVASDEDDILEDENMLGSEGLPGLDEPGEDPSPGGRPSKERLDACDRICKKLGEWVIAESKAEGVEASDIYDRFGGKVLRAQRRKSRWNGYQSYAVHPTYRDVELGRLKGSECPWDGESSPTTLQLRAAYKLFIEEKGEDEARSLMDVWNMLRSIEAVQKKGERKRTFKAIVTQLKNFAEYIRNRYNIHLWAVIAGGQIRSDQLYTFVCGLHESAGFAKGALAVGEDDIGELFQAWIFNRNAAKFTNQQIAAMAHERGLKITGPGIDEEMGPSATTPSTPLPIPTPEIRITTRSGAPTKKVKKENVRATIRVAVKTRFDECLSALNKTFKVASNLPWSTLASECVELGLQITNYPQGIYYPWTEIDRANKTNRGIRNIPPEHQSILVDACEEDHEHRLTIVNADPIELASGLIPVLVTAPDVNGKTSEFFAKDIPGCLEAVNKGASAKKKVKFEVEESLPAASSARTKLNRSAKNKPKPDYGDKDIEVDELEELDELTQSEDETEDTPRAPKAGNGSGNQGRRSRKPAGTSSPAKGSSKVARKLTSPFATMGNEPSVSSAPAPSTPKRKDPKKVITTDDLNAGAFVPTDLATSKRTSDTLAAGEGPPNKRARQDPKATPPVPPPATEATPRQQRLHDAAVHQRNETPGPVSTSPQDPPQWQQPPPVPYHAQYMHSHMHPQYASSGSYQSQFTGLPPPNASSSSFHGHIHPHPPPNTTSHMPPLGTHQQPAYPGPMPQALQAQMEQLLRSFYEQQPIPSAQQMQPPPPPSRPEQQ